MHSTHSHAGMHLAIIKQGAYTCTHQAEHARRHCMRARTLHFKPCLRVLQQPWPSGCTGRACLK